MQYVENSHYMHQRILCTDNHYTVNIAPMELRAFLTALRLRKRGVAARELCVSPQLVCAWLNGTRRPDRRTLLLAELLWGSKTAGDWPLS